MSRARSKQSTTSLDVRSALRDLAGLYDLVVVDVGEPDHRRRGLRRTSDHVESADVCHAVARHELSLVAGARTGLEQNLHALARLEDGTYGICENCGNPIGKLRLQAYPRATLCMSCKSRQERR